MAISKFEVKGDDAIAQRLSTIAGRYNHAKIGALGRVAEPKLAEMQRRTPVETYALRDSGRMALGQSGNTASVIFLFGGDEYHRPDGTPVDYGPYVHEDLTLHHPHGQAKFMSSVLNESRSSLGRELADELHVEKVAR